MNTDKTFTIEYARQMDPAENQQLEDAYYRLLEGLSGLDEMRSHLGEQERIVLDRINKAVDNGFAALGIL